MSFFARQRNPILRWRSPRAIQADVLLHAQLLLLVIFFAEGVYFIVANSQTYDEAMHLAAGYSYFAKRDFRLEPQNPPLIKELQALPLWINGKLIFNPGPQEWRDSADFLIGYNFLYRSALPADAILAVGRFVNLAMGSFLVALIAWWSYRLWGSPAAVVALSLACFDPNLIAHSALATTDIGVSFFIFLSVYIFWEYLRSPGWALMCATGASAGAAVVSKYSGILLFPIICLIVLCLLLSGDVRVWVPGEHTHTRTPGARLLEITALLLVVFSCALLIIPPVYFFQGFRPWLSGLMLFLKLGHQGQPGFFLGEHSYSGWWSYFVVAFATKTPIGSLLLITASIVFCRLGKSLRRREAVFLLVPVLIILGVTTQARVNIGLRHILAVYPFLFVLASRAATIRFGPRFLAPLITTGMVVFTASSSLRIAPHQLAYFNEFIGGPDQGYRYLSDSNLDWGQDLKGLKAYMMKEKLPIICFSYFGTASPSYYGIRYQYVPGTWPLKWPPHADKVPANAPRKVLAISVYNLQDVGRPYDPLFRWLWARSPIAKIGYSIFVYDLTDDRDGLAKLEETYRKAGIPQLE